jgi:hypothetical protein
MLCAEHDSLQKEHQAAVQKFRASIRDLVVLVDHSAADADLDTAHRRIRGARHICEVARDAVEYHQTKHGCLTDVLRPVLCEAKDRLLHEYNRAVVEFSRVVTGLADVAGTSKTEDYRILGLEKDRSRARLQKARDAFVRHLAEHGCGGSKNPK